MKKQQKQQKCCADKAKGLVSDTMCNNLWIEHRKVVDAICHMFECVCM